MAEYRFEARDLRTGVLLGDLPLGSVAWSQGFDGQGVRGTLRGRINLMQRASTGARLTAGFLDGTRLARTVIWLYRDGVPLDGFIVWQRPKRIGGRHLEINAASLLSYFGRRTLNATKSYTAVDQHDIARDLVTYMQAQTGGNVGIVNTTTNDSGVVRDRLPIAFGYERKNIGELLEQLAAVEQGFEYAVDVALVADVPQATFRCSYPKRGRTYGQTGMLLIRSGDNSGNLLDYDLDEDAVELVTTVHAIGAGEGTDMLLSTQSDTSLIDGGWPLLEDVISLKDVSAKATLDSHARAHVKRHGLTGMERWGLRVDPDDVSVPFGSWIVGDEARVVVEDDERFPAGVNGEPGFDRVMRIVGQTVTVQDDGGPDIVMLDVEVSISV